MDKKTYDKQLIRWVKNHYWDGLEKDKDLILRHLRTFVGDDIVYKAGNCPFLKCEFADRCNAMCDFVRGK